MRRVTFVHCIRAEARAVGSYLIGSDAPAHEPLTVQPELAEAGKQHFVDLNCAACHELDGMRAPRPPTRKILNLQRGCLSGEDSTTPRFSLDDRQRKALVKSLGSRSGQLSDSARIATIRQPRTTSSSARSS